MYGASFPNKHVKMRFDITIIIVLLQGLTYFCLNISPLVQKALHIADSTYAFNFATYIAWCSTNSDEQVTQFLQTFKGSVRLTPLRNENQKQIRKYYQQNGYKQTVFFAKDVEEFDEFVTTLKEVIVVPIRLILVLTKPITDAKITDVTKTAWDNYPTDLIIISESEDDKIKLTTYYPYKDGTCNDISPGPVKDDKEWFPLKFMNFKGCPIRVTVLPFAPYIKLPETNETALALYGMDGIMFSLIKEKLNATLELIICSDRGKVGTYINGTGTGCFGDLIYNRSDIFVPTLVIDHLRYPVVQITHSLHMVDISWFGPPRKPKNQWLKILRPFLTDVSHAVNATFMIFIIVTNLLKRYGFQRGEHSFSVTLQSLIILMGQGARLQTRSLLLNYLFVIWIWFCVIIRIVYQVDLVDALQITVLEQPLQYLDQALKEVDGYGGLEYPRYILKGTKYYENFRLLNFNEVRLKAKQLSGGERFLLATETLMATEMGTNLQKLKHPLSRLLVCFTMRPGWQPAKEFNIILVRLIEAGILDKIVRNEVNGRTKNEEHCHDHRYAQPLNIIALSGGFYGLGFMYLICIIVFIAEIIYYNVMVKPVFNTIL